MTSSVLKLTVRALYKVFALSAVLTLAMASVALADDVTNRIDGTVDATLENLTLSEGQSQSVAFGVIQKGGDGEGGCNIDAGEQLVAAIASANTSVATVTPPTVTFANCTVDQNVTITAGARGTSNITVVQDPAPGSNTTGIGTFNYTTADFTTTVTNVPPTISNISDQSTNEDTSTGPIAFTVGDAGTPAGNLTLTSSSSNTTLVPNANITFGGSDANRTVNITPAANGSGTATITVGVSDGAATTTDTFVLTVNSANDTPSFTQGSNETVSEDAAAQTVLNWATSISSGPADESSQTVSFTATNDNNALFSTQPAISSNGTLTYTPAANANGTATVAVRAQDSGGTANGGDDTSAPQSFTITVNAVDDAPTAAAQSVTTNEDTAKTITLTGSDLDGDAQSFEIITDPSDGSLGTIGTPTCTGMNPKDCEAEVTYTPDTNFNGSDSFQFRVNDGSTNSADATVSITVDPVNDDPMISDIADQTTNEDSPTGDIPFNVADVETPLGDLTVSGSSSNTTLVPDANIEFGGSGANRTVTIMPAPNQSGTATITVSVSVADGLATATDTFDLTVSPVNDTPLATLTGPNTVNEGSSRTYNFAVSDPDPGDTFTVNGGFPDCGSGGVLVENSLNTTPAGGTFECRFPDGPASTDVRIQVADAQDVDGNVDALSVAVANVAPAIQLTGPAAADEGDAKTYGYTVTDPGVDTHTNDTRCGLNGEKVAGSDTYDAGAGSFQCRFPDGPATTRVSSTTTDSDGASDADNQFVDVGVENVAPTVELSGPAAADEGATKTYAYTVADPGDSNHTITESCGPNGTWTNTPQPNNFECTFPDGPANSTVSATAVDPAGDSGDDEIAVQVSNVAPAVELDGPAIASEGQTGTYDYTVTDPGVDPNPAITESCGANGAYEDTPALDSFRCTFALGPTTSMVNVDANDGDDAGSDGIVVDISNVAPTISDITDQSTNQDVAAGPIAFTVGDAGTPVENLTVTGSSSNTALVPDANIAFDGSGANQTVTITPVNGQTGAATITVMVSDGNAQTTDTFILTVNPVEPVDSVAPWVTTPLPGGKKVSPKAKVTAKFSEEMAAGTLNNTTFVLTSKGVQVPATITYDDTTYTATLTTTAKLKKGATYVATVTSGAEDMNGNTLDQDSNAAGDQSMVWSFKVRR